MDTSIARKIEVKNRWEWREDIKSIEEKRTIKHKWNEAQNFSSE